MQKAEESRERGLRVSDNPAFIEEPDGDAERDGEPD
jgi:hypothetical protein